VLKTLCSDHLHVLRILFGSKHVDIRRFFCSTVLFFQKPHVQFTVWRRSNRISRYVNYRKILSIFALVFVITFRHVLKLEWRVLCPPPRHVDELEGVILKQGLLVAQYFNVFVVVGWVQQLFGDKLFEMCDGCKWRTSNKLPIQIGFECDGVMRRRLIRQLAFEKNVDLWSANKLNSVKKHAWDQQNCS